MNQERYESRLRLLPCCVCIAIGVNPPRPCQELHHAFEVELRDDRLQVPICWPHHQGPEGIHTLRRRTFFKENAISDANLIAITIGLFLRSLA